MTMVIMVQRDLQKTMGLSISMRQLLRPQETRNNLSNLIERFNIQENKKNLGVNSLRSSNITMNMKMLKINFI
jgi:serine kinase of HPr protein (carbohydrate metabolism regulator)